MTEDVREMYCDGGAGEDIKTLYANRAYLLANRGVIERTPEMYECCIDGVFFGMMYGSGPAVDFLHLLEE